MINILKEPDIILWDKSIYKKGGQCKKTVNGSVTLCDGKVLVKAPDGVSYLTLRWLGEIEDSSRIFGDMFERSYGNLEWRSIIPQRVMPWYCVAYDGKICEGFGVKVRANSFCYWQIDECGVSLTLDLRCGSIATIISEELCAAELVHMVSEERPYAFMNSFCEKMSDKPVFPKAPVYGSNSWYYCYSASNRDLVIKDAELLKELTAGVENRPYAVVDCGWSVSVKPDDPCAGTALAQGNEAFGNMKTLADEVKKRDVHPGIWLRPLCVSTGQEVPEEMILRHVNPGEYPCLDPSLPEVLGIVAEDVKKATVEWGYELIKIDFSTYDLLGKFHSFGDINAMNGDWHFTDRHKTTAQIIKDFYKTIADNAGDAVIIGCNCIGHLSSGYFHIHRIGDDTSGILFERTRIMGVNTLAFRLCQHKTFFAIDADCIGQTESISWEMNKQWLKLLASSGTPLFVSIHPDTITDEQKEVLTESYKRASMQTDTLEPLNFTDTVYPNHYLVNGKEETFKWLEDIGVTDFTTKE